jgi:hypothetical protein
VQIGGEWLDAPEQDHMHATNIHPNPSRAQCSDYIMPFHCESHTYLFDGKAPEHKPCVKGIVRTSISSK